MSSPLASVKNPTPWWRKCERLDLSDFEWNIPEQEQGRVLIIGGNLQSFALPVKIGELLGASYPLKELRILLPDALRGKLPSDERFLFAPSTPSGSMAESALIGENIAASDATLVLGDLSKNPVTAEAVAEGILTGSARGVTAGTRRGKILLTRDSIDLLLPYFDRIIERPLSIVGSVVQLKKILQAIYYPKVLLLSMPLLPVVELLHKFTLSYPAEIITFHEGLILAAREGKVISLPIGATDYTPLTLWQGRLAAKYLALSLYNGELIK